MKRVLSLVLLVSMILSMMLPGVSAAEPPQQLRNVALGKSVTSGWGEDVPYWQEPNETSFVTDGDTYSDPGIGQNNTFTLDRREAANSNHGDASSQYITIDLGQSYDISQIKYFGSVPGDEGYVNISKNMVFRVSNDPNFQDESTKTVFNSDRENTWGFGAGTDTDEANTHEGRTITFEPVNARYVRYYQNAAKQGMEGTELTDLPWLSACEIEVYAQVPVDLTEYTVTFQPENGEAEFTQTVRAGTAAEQPETPEKEGYYFLGWMLDGEMYDFGTPVTQDITLAAKWAGEGENMEPNDEAQPAGNYAWGLTATFGYVKNGEEVSLDSSSMQQGDRIRNLTDGAPNKDNWVSPPDSYTVAANGPAYMQVDLGGWTAINEIITWQYFGRSYYQAVQVSANGFV